LAGAALAEVITSGITSEAVTASADSARKIFLPLLVFPLPDEITTPVSIGVNSVFIYSI
jgi:hypothetical protein